MISGDPGVLDLASNAGKRMEWYRETLGDIDILLCRGNIFSFIDKFLMAQGMMWQKKYDVITAQDIEHAFLAWSLSRLHGVPWQMQIHTDIFSPYFVEHSALNKIRVVLAKFLLPRADGIRVVSERIKSSITAYGIRHTAISVLPIFVDAEKIKNTPIKTDLHKKYPGRFIILMASRITKEKNIALAIEAMKELTIHPKNPLFVIVGDGPELENLKKTTKGLRLENSVSFLPFTDGLISYYKTCDLFLLTSNYEGYGMTLIEVALAGAKIISTDVGIAPEILLPENIIAVGDKLALSATIFNALEGNINPALEPKIQTKEEYLRLYKESLEICVKNK